MGINYISTLIIVLLVSACDVNKSDKPITESDKLSNQASSLPANDDNNSDTYNVKSTSKSFGGVSLGDRLDSVKKPYKQQSGIARCYFTGPDLFSGTCNYASKIIYEINYNCGIEQSFPDKFKPLTIDGIRCGQYISPDARANFKVLCSDNKLDSMYYLVKNNAYFFMNDNDRVHQLSLKLKFERDTQLDESGNPEYIGNNYGEEFCVKSDNLKAIAAQELYGLNSKAIDSNPIPDIRSAACENYTPACSSDVASFNRCAIAINALRPLEIYRQKAGAKTALFNQQIMALETSSYTIEAEPDPTTKNFLVSVSMAFVLDGEAATNYVNSGLAFADCFMLRTGNSSMIKSRMQEHIEANQ